ncbi:alcohol dehydrogenase [Exophiala viscosa]|uniref:alcohol dehydrogenase n=1 Tax=Exophiala viscosa TaxID=2486360 RepID=UPI00219EAD8F|nr:alcohol dehydrogenase [Exophiala viscosa]
MADPALDIPSEMLAVQVVRYNKPLAIHKIPTPSVSKLGPYDLLLRTAVASLCHTDLMVHAGIFPGPLPLTMSHEGTGVVVAKGDAVKDYQLGDRVLSGLPFHQCGKCEHCNPSDGQDWAQYCQAAEGATGIKSDGAFAEYHVVDARASCKIPDNVSFVTAAPLACAGVTVYRAILVSGVKEGGWMALVGAGGGLGHFGIQFAKAKGINVIAIEAREEGLEVAKKAGAEHLLDAREGKDKIVEKVQALTGGKGVEATVNVSDHSSTAALSAAITRMHGTVVQAAQPQEVSVPFMDIVLRDITIKGTMLGGRGVTQEMLEVASKHGVTAETQVFYGLEEVPKMIELSESGRLKGKAVCVVDKKIAGMT